MVKTLGLSGFDALWLFQGAMNTNTFEIYVAQVWVLTSSPGDWVICDNLPVHKSSTPHSLIEMRGHVIFLPPYSPDWNPIEPWWSKVKAASRAVKA